MYFVLCTRILKLLEENLKILEIRIHVQFQEIIVLRKTRQGLLRRNTHKNQKIL